MSLDSASEQGSPAAKSSYTPTHTTQTIGSRWAIAAGPPLAAEAGARMLNAGGNAVDAGVAAGICLGVVHVDMVSVAGVAPILVHLAQRRETFQVSGVGPYPALSTPEFFRTRHGGANPPRAPPPAGHAAPPPRGTAPPASGTPSLRHLVW